MCKVKTMKQVFFCLALALCVMVGCGRRPKELTEAQRHFVAITTSDSTSHSFLYAEALFQGSVPLQPKVKQYVYVVNASCSKCITTAIDCCKVGKEVDPKASFRFLSLEEDTDIFEYYLEQEFGEAPEVYIAPESMTWPEGLYTVENDLVMALSAW